MYSLLFYHAASLNLGHRSWFVSPLPGAPGDYYKLKKITDKSNRIFEHDSAGKITLASEISA